MKLQQAAIQGHDVGFTIPLMEKFALLSISGGADAAIFILLLQGAPQDYSPKERFLSSMNLLIYLNEEVISRF